MQQGSYEDVKNDDSVTRTLQDETEVTKSEIIIKTEDSKTGSLDKESNEASQDITRQTGDLAVYQYYFKSIGIVSMSMFLFFVTVHVFCSTFGRKYSPFDFD